MAKSAYRMIVIDLDGTLLGPGGTVSARTKIAVQNLVAAGVLVCFATGRNLTESRAILDAVNHQGLGVFVGGAMVVDAKLGKTLHRTLMDQSLAAEICHALEADGHAVLALQDTSHAGVDYLITDDVTLNDATVRWINVTAAAFRRVISLGKHRHEHTIRVGICASPSHIAAAKKRLAERFGGRILCQSLFVPAYDVEVVEVFDPDVSKWKGVLQVAHQYGVKAKQIIAIGDDINDLPLMQHAGLGVAMGNAKPEVKAAAAKVIGPNTEDGLAAYLEELLATHAVEPIGRAGSDAAA